MNIVITGASNGLGFETALLLSVQGHTVFAIARNNKNLQKLKEEAVKLNKESIMHLIVADITEEDGLKKIKEDISIQTNTLDVLINNAGMLVNKPFTDLTTEDW